MVRTYRNPQPGSLGGMFAPGSRPPNGNGFSPDSKVSYKKICNYYFESEVDFALNLLQSVFCEFFRMAME